MLEKHVLFEPFKQQIDFLEYALSGQYTTIIYGGSIRSGKTFAGLGLLLLLCKMYPRSRWVVVRKDLLTIKRNTIPSWNKIKPRDFAKSFDMQTMTAKMKNGSEIMFFGENYDKDKDFNRWRGLECNGFLLEEINELQEQGYYKALERAGSYIIPNTDKQPKPIIIGTVNPTQGWVKEKFYDKFKKGTLDDSIKFVLANIKDNHYIPEEYKKNLKQLPKYEYAVFVDGNWDIQLKTGGEFLKSFELENHVQPIHIEKNNILHISIDSNVLPYIAVSVWQIEKLHHIDYTKYHAIQVNELPAKDPINTARKSALNLVKWLQDIGYEDKLMIYGDPTTKNSNNIDDDKKSFFTLFTETLRNNGFDTQDKMSRSNKSVSAMGDFVNAILEDRVKEISITIGENCKTSINDYIETKQDKDGGILKKRVTDPKTKATYEPNGHFTDNFKDFVCQAFSSEFRNFQRKLNDIAPIVGYRNKKR